MHMECLRLALPSGGAVSAEQIVTFAAIVVFAFFAAYYWLKIGRRK